MRNIIIAGVSTLALTVAGCSMFHSRSSEQAAAGPSSQPSYSTSAKQSYSSNDSSGTSTAPMSGTSQSAAATQPSSAPSQAGMTMNADEVKQAQQKLKDDGDYKGAIDGKAGPQTMAALKEFQQKNGLSQTGKLDEQTADKLGLSSMSEGSGSSAPPSAQKSQ